MSTSKKIKKAPINDNVAAPKTASDQASDGIGCLSARAKPIAISASPSQALGRHNRPR